MAESRQERELRERYRRSLMGKAAEIAEYQIKVSDKMDSNELTGVLEELDQHLHKLAGSSGMYGYTHISDCSRTAMRIVRDGHFAEIESQLLVLRNLLELHA